MPRHEGVLGEWKSLCILNLGTIWR